MTNAASPNYPGNSHKAKAKAIDPNKPPKEKLEKVIEGVVVERKKPLGKRILATFTGDDSRSVGNYLLFDVILPATKQLISDIAIQGVERVLFGDGARPSQGRPGYRTPYNRMSSNGGSRRNEPRTISQTAKRTHDFNEIILETREDAQRILDDLRSVLEQFDVVTVSDLYDLVGITGSFQDDKWGWFELNNAPIRRIAEGYLLELPKTTVID